jgi:alkylation response protein AidB-like acyl-CoA dehydrogenase
VQGKPPVAAASGPLPIIHHPDVKRMLLSMKAHRGDARARPLCRAQLDLGGAHPDEARARRRRRAASC